MHNAVSRILLGALGVIMLVGFSFLTHGANLENVKFYEIEEGRIHYEMSGINKGTESMEWNNWGRKTVRQTKSTMSMMGITQSTDQLGCTDGLWVYNVDQAVNTATKMEKPISRIWPIEKILI